MPEKEKKNDTPQSQESGVSHGTCLKKSLIRLRQGPHCEGRKISNRMGGVKKSSCYGPELSLSVASLVISKVVFRSRPINNMSSWCAKLIILVASILTPQSSNLCERCHEKLTYRLTCFWWSGLTSDGQKRCFAWVLPIKAEIRFHKMSHCKMVRQNDTRTIPFLINIWSRASRASG